MSNPPQRAIDSFSKRWIGVYFLYGSLDPFVMFNGQLITED